MSKEIIGGLKIKSRYKVLKSSKNGDFLKNEEMGVFDEKRTDEKTYTLINFKPGLNDIYRFLTENQVLNSIAGMEVEEIIIPIPSMEKLA